MQHDFQSLPFARAIEFFRDKLSIPTERWTDLWRDQNARGFMVAGAAKAELLSDLRAAVDRALSEEMGLEGFRRRFDEIVERHGWSYKGGRDWRTQIILRTNIRTSYAAGRYKQMTEPDVLSRRPYWEYRHGGSAEPRIEHLGWHGLVLRADDPWWDVHYPPNGWGCKCRVFALSERDMERMGKTGPDKAPTSGSYEWRDKKTGEVFEVPKGVDPGWDYNVGRAAWGKKISESSMSAWRAEGAGAWKSLTPGNRESAARPKAVPADRPRADLGPVLGSTRDAAQALERVLGGPEKVFTSSAGHCPVLVNAEALAGHIPLDRTPYIPLLPEVLEDPFEIWMSFEKHRDTGKVVLRQRFVKVFSAGKEARAVLVAQVNGGTLEAWTLVPPAGLDDLNDQRRGVLVFGR